jgi:hypothetical protein
MDRTIALYDLKGGFLLKMIHKAHETAIRHVTGVDFGSFLVSCGYESFAKVWAPDNLISDNFIGTLNSVNKAIIIDMAALPS